MSFTSFSGLTRRGRQAFSLAGLAASVLRRSVGRRFPPLSLQERLAMLPAAAPVSAPLTIRWSDQHVPFVEAACERDAAVGLGIVHGHLRLAQMEVMRRAAYGRIAEVAGEAALAVDRLLRIIDFPRACAPSLALMPAETRAWIDGFADGINAAATVRPLPPEFDMLGLEPEPWTAADLFAVSRLCSADYAWRVWRTLSPLRQEDDWARMWADLMGVAAIADEDIPIGADTLDKALPNAFDHAGSNAVAVSGSRTRSGKPILASDPHHLITTPGLWLIAGFKTPASMVWGLMIPALPIFGVGRNRHGAWGGTNLHATSSELVDVAGEPLTSEEHTIGLRDGSRHTVLLRQSTLGPIVSDDGPFALDGETVALHWLGHRPSDEFTPFRTMLRARDYRDFAVALDGYALPGLNMLWAGEGGEIGKLIAAHIPRRPLAIPPDIVVDRAVAHDQWHTLLSTRDLPQSVDPTVGFVVSANEPPVDPPVTISLFFAAPHRAERIAALVGERRDLTAADLAALQRDVHLAPAASLAARLVAVARAHAIGGPVVDALAAWDGDYGTHSAGALALELVAPSLVDQLETRSPKRYVSPHWRPFSRLSGLVDAAGEADLADALRTAVAAAEAPFARHGTWGALHHVRLAHPLTRLPLVGARLPTIDFPSGGSNDTLMKSMHPMTQKPHATNFGANARFVADLADPDATSAVLLGGQDGWPGSRTMFDQVGAWRRGEALPLPFTDAARADALPHTTTILPA
ncbi:penicillin acylase family protein [Acuticoccus mangrovi]|uniref:Penicillin acylase family protein n=1 Tax=Acuticoccus mangrovi TaxID=2796142 RepID=A0A934ILA0_9HYPH|nr:penicillin acylase family protein [Acuticoccus mangrovi]MBJ3778593.1 penicillin acylase family protein [Acuticoccus mangrovi]